MQNMHIYMLLAGIFGFNLYLLLVRRAKTRKSLRDAINNRAAAERQINEIRKRLEREQNEAVRHIERKNKTLAMYEMVRRRAEDNDIDGKRDEEPYSGDNMTYESENPYESERLYENMPDTLLRPGGFELTERLLEFSGLNKNGEGHRILDVGCGAGAAVRFLAQAGFTATGADVSDKLIDKAKKMTAVESMAGGTEFVTARGESLPFEDACFDAVMFECSFSLMDGKKAINEAERVLKSGGFLLVSDVFRGTDGTGEMQTLDEFVSFLEINGFEVTHTEDKTNVFESFIGQVIMSTGSLDTLFSCGEWADIKKARPRYALVAARKL